MQHTERQCDHLQILTSSGSRDVARLRPHVIDNSPLQPGDQQVCAFVDDLFLHSRQPIEDDSPRTTLDIVEGGVEEHGTDGHGAGQPVDIVKGVGHDE